MPTNTDQNSPIRRAISWRPSTEDVAIFLIFACTAAAAGTICAAAIMETAASPGPYLERQPRNGDAPEQTDREWDIRIKLVTLLKDRAALLDAVEQRSHAAGGRTLARSTGSVTVLIDEANAEAMTTMARQAWNAPLGQEYLAWAAGERYSPTADRPADTVLHVKLIMPTTSHPATPPTLLYGMLSAGLIYLALICLCSGIFQRRGRRIRRGQ